jgi:hypothetical protein
MKPSWYLFWGRFHLFWFVRHLIRKCAFALGKSQYTIRFNVRDEQSNVFAFNELIKLTKVQLPFAILLAALLQYFDPKIDFIFSLLHFNKTDEGIYGTFFNTVSAIGGVFIALYYAGINSIGSSVYSRVPSYVRELLAKERVGFVYMRFLAFTTFLSLCFLSLRGLGYPQVKSAVLLISFLSGIGIFGFIRLGQRVFHLFDPSQLANSLFYELDRNVKSVSAGGFQWDDQAFQEHHRKQAKKTLSGLLMLIDLLVTDSHLKGVPYGQLVQKITLFLAKYQRFKKTIPTISMWYDRMIIHKTWYLSNESSTSLATQKYSILDPDTIYDNHWVEKTLHPVLIDCLRMNLNSEKFDIVLELLQYIEYYLEEVVKEGELLHAQDLTVEIIKLIFEKIALPSDKPVINDEKIDYIAIAEHLTRMLTELSFAYMKHLDSISIEAISKKLSSVKWSDNTRLYNIDIPVYLLPTIEKLQARLSFENKIEDQVISPLWYQTEIVLKPTAVKFKEGFECLIIQNASQFENMVSLTKQSNRPWLTASILVREWEYWSKIELQMEKISSFWNSYESFRRIEDPKWPQLDTNYLTQKIADRKNKVFVEMATIGAYFPFLKRNDRLPDYGGQFVHITGEALLNAFFEGNIELVQNLFALYFLGCNSIFNAIKPKAQSATDFDLQTQNSLRIALAPLIDLIDLSGYGLLFAEFHNKPEMKQIVFSVWDTFTTGNLEHKKLFASAVELTESTFGIPYRGVNRTTWKQRVRNVLATLPSKERYKRGGISFLSDPIVFHDSALVRLFASDDYGIRDGITIFIYYYFSNTPEFSSLSFGRNSIQDLEHLLNREVEDYEAYITKGDEEE